MSSTSWLRKVRSSLAPSQRERKHRRRPTALRLTLEALEDRSLPSCMVSLSPSEAAPQLVGERITWTATAADCGATPVSTSSASRPRAASSGWCAISSPTNAFAWTPSMQEGHLRRQGRRQGWISGDRDDHRRGGRRRRLAGDWVTAGHHAHDQSPRRPLQRPAHSSRPRPARHRVRRVQRGGDLLAAGSTNDLPTNPGKSTNFFVAGMLPNTTYEMRDVFSDEARLLPALHDRQPADDAGVPRLHRAAAARPRERRRAGHDLPPSPQRPEQRPEPPGH